MSVTRRQFAPYAASAAALAAASPALGQSTNEIVKWRLTSSYPKSLDTLWGASLTIARIVGEMTDGKFTLQPFGAGEIVPSLQVLDAVSNGNGRMRPQLYGLLHRQESDLHLRRLAAVRPDAAHAECLDDVRRRPQADGRGL